MNLAIRIGKLYKKGNEVYWQCGELLSKQQKKNKGKFRKWLKENRASLGFNHVTAWRLIKCFASETPPNWGHEKKEKKQRVAIGEVTITDPNIICSSMQDFLSKQKDIDAIITDPPYGRGSIGLYEDLARLADECLKPEGVLAVMCGQLYLPKILPLMAKYRPYRWTLAYLTPGGQSPQIWPKKVNTFWKPILLFGGCIDWIGDVVKTAANDNDKRFHGWGQSEAGMGQLVDLLSVPGETICDPFLGGGTTAVVSTELGRKFIGCDISPEAIKTTLWRLQCQKLEKSAQAGAI